MADQEEEVKKGKGGRPLKEVDEKLLEKLAKLHLSDKAMADCVGVHVDTLHTRYSEKIEIWRSKSKGKIAEVLFDEGLNRRREYAVKMLAQKHLDYADKVEKQSKLTIVDELDELTVEEIEKELRILQDINE